MPSDPRVQELIDQLLASGGTPDEVCRAAPELLPEVRTRWQRTCQAQAELDALFPPFDAPGPTSREQDLKLPQIPGYEVQAVLGRGGMGVVFRARHLRLNRVVALKMTLAGAYAGPAERERFQREAEAAAGLKHPNIVQVYDVGESEGRAFFTMELLEGGNLAQKLNGAGRPPRDSAALVAALAGAVHVAHLSGVVHRDLKPANVLMTAADVPKIGDFGLARQRDRGADLTRSGAVLGTPSYMAPEQAAGKPDAAAPAVDVYALGAILYELLTGRPPFRSEAPAETVQLVLTRDPAAPSRFSPRVPRDLDVVCLKCLNKSPHLRYESAEALKDDLERFQRGEAIAARAENPLGRQLRRIRRRPVHSTLVAVGALFAATLIGGGLWLWNVRAAAETRERSEQAAAEQIAADDLSVVVNALRRASWSEARTALARARVALNGRAVPHLSETLERATRELELVGRLEAVRLGAAASVDGKLMFSAADAEYETVFREAGLARVGDAPAELAARIRGTNIQGALVAALDHWSACTEDPARKRWASQVAGAASDDPTGWRDRALDPAVWADEGGLMRLLQTAPAPEQAAPLLLTIEQNASAPLPRRIVFLQRLHEMLPLDFWVNLRLGDLLTSTGKGAEAIGCYRTALVARPDAPVVHNNLGSALAQAGRTEEALKHYRRAIELDPSAGAAHFNLTVFLWNSGHGADAVAHLPLAIRLNPGAANLRVLRGKHLESLGLHVEALAELRAAVALEPTNRLAQRALREELVARGRYDEARAVWGKALTPEDGDHDNWYGYAELCAFLGDEDEYRRARRALLAKFGSTLDPVVAERTSRACLLRPADGDELQRGVALATRAASADRGRYKNVYHAFAFVKGLAEFRQGQFDRAIATMTGDASRALGPAPQLVIAMSRYQSGKRPEAKKLLAAVVSANDWRADRVRNQDDWICQVLRQEAERMIVPDLPALVAGNRSAGDDNERLILLGAYEFSHRYRDAARVFADAFATNPDLGAEFAPRRRFLAASMACLAARDPKEPSATERGRWRAAARTWIRADLIDYAKLLDINFTDSRAWVHWSISTWLSTPDLAAIREPSELERMSPTERKECEALWATVDAIVNRTSSAKR